MSRWSLVQAPDQIRRTAVVTGANVGLGFRTAVGLAQRGARVVMACRDVAKGEAALDRLRAAAPVAEAEVRALELADLASVRDLMAGNKIEEVGAAALNRIVAQSDEQGALPILYAATMDLPGGAYVGPDGLGEMRGGPRLVGASKAATDLETAARLWALSEELTGVSYDFAGRATSAR